jgi:hypothetical protein
MSSSRQQYEFVPTSPSSPFQATNIYVATFVAGLNAGQFTKHALEPGRAPERHGWSWGIPPRYFDGRVTSTRTSWLYATKDGFLLDGTCASVRLTDGDIPIGWLRKLP